MLGRDETPREGDPTLARDEIPPREEVAVDLNSVLVLVATRCTIMGSFLVCVNGLNPKTKLLSKNEEKKKILPILR